MIYLLLLLVLYATGYCYAFGMVWRELADRWYLITLGDLLPLILAVVILALPSWLWLVRRR